MYISYNVVDGNEYATVVRSVRDGAKVSKEDRVYLGRVVDKERGVYRSKARGLFTYDLTTGEFGPAPDDVKAPKRRSAKRSRPMRTVSFGDTYLLDSFLRSSGLMDCLDACGHAEPDTVRALTAFYVLTGLRGYHAEDWWELTYAHYLYPRAKLSSAEIVACLDDLGAEDGSQRLMAAYLGLAARGDEAAGGVLMDFADIAGGTRLVYVEQRGTGLPLLCRWSTADMSAVMRAIAELRGAGVGTELAILDAGGYADEDVGALVSDAVPFLMRMSSGSDTYEEVVAAHLATLESDQNATAFDGRTAYVQPVPCTIGTGREGWAYLCQDSAMRHELEDEAAGFADERGLCGPEAYDPLAARGVFVLAGTGWVERGELLSLYHVRERARKVIELARRGGWALPMSVWTREAYRGHLLMCLMATVVTKMMSDVLAVSETSLTAGEMLWILHEHHAVVYDKELVTVEPTRQMEEAYAAFGITCPETISV